MKDKCFGLLKKKRSVEERVKGKFCRGTLFVEMIVMNHWKNYGGGVQKHYDEA